MTQCSPCGEFFTGTTAFDRHRVGKHEPLARRCLTTSEMEAIGMYQDERGRWANPITEEKRAQLRALKEAARA